MPSTLNLIARYLAAAILYSLGIASYLIAIPLWLFTIIVLLPLSTILGSLISFLYPSKDKLFQFLDKYEGGFSSVSNFISAPASFFWGIGTWAILKCNYLFRKEDYRVSEVGINIKDLSTNESNIVSWDEIASVEQTFNPPLFSYSIMLENGESKNLGIFIDSLELISLAKEKNITIIETKATDGQ